MGSRGVRITLEDERIGQHGGLPLPRGAAHVRRARRTRTRRPCTPTSSTSTSRCRRRRTPEQEYIIECALQYTDGYQESVFTFVNNINTHGGGTHLAGLKAALTRTLNNYIKQHKLVKEGAGRAQWRGLPRGPHGGALAGGSRAAVRGPDQGQARATARPRALVESVVAECISATYLEENPAPAKAVVQKGDQRAGGARGGAQGTRPRAAQVGPGQRRHAGQAGGLPEP